MRIAKQNKWILWLAILLCGNTAMAQLQITQYPVGALQIKVSDVFNASVTNMGGNTEVYFTATVVNVNSGKKVLEAKTQSLDIGPGFQQLNEQKLQPVYRYGDESIEQSGVLGYGAYKICLLAFATANNEELANSCLDAEVTAMSPPLLLSPENEAVVPVQNPLLVWLAPTPINPKLGIKYSLKLCEILPNQTPFDAIHRNPAILQVDGISPTNLLYPANALPLEIGKRYAWKVAATSSQGLLIGETEVWWFTRKNIEELPDDDPAPVKSYIRLKHENSQDYVNVKDEMKVIYEEKYGNVLLQLTIRNSAGKVIYQDKLNAAIGENRYVLKLDEMGGLKGNTFYFLEVTAPERPTQYLMFKNLR